MPPYDPGGLFSKDCLSRIEKVAGIQILSTLAKIPRQLVSVAGVHMDAHNHWKDYEGTVICIEMIIDEWKPGKSRRPPTWRSLLDVLRELDLKDLSQDLEEYMQGEYEGLMIHKATIYVLIVLLIKIVQFCKRKSYVRVLFNES